jgi:hypothetical protein
MIFQPLSRATAVRLFCGGRLGADPVTSYSAGRDIAAEPESTMGTKFDIAATDQIRPIASTTAMIHASILLPLYAALSLPIFRHPDVR